jgi:hypothetical protein
VSDTPETDDLARGNHVVPTDWAEQLERERDEARNQRDILRLDAQKEDIHHDRMIGELERVYAERDEAREQRDSLQALSQSLAETCVKLRAERDEARTTIEDAKRALIATDYEGILLAAMRVKEERDEARRVLCELKKEGNT